MALEGVFDLCAPDVILHAAHLFTQAQAAPIIEADVFIPRLGVDLGHHKAILVIVAFIRERK